MSADGGHDVSLLECLAAVKESEHGTELAGVVGVGEAELLNSEEQASAVQAAADRDDGSISIVAGQRHKLLKAFSIGLLWVFFAGGPRWLSV